MSRSRRIGSFFQWLGGGDAATIDRAPRERHKFTGLGGVVLMTATVAAASFMFALVMGLGTPVPVAVVLGLVWGMFIANLDRWLVTATVRHDRWWQNLGLALPRLFLALVIGAVVSTPLVLQIFHSEIRAELGVIHQEKVKSYEDLLATDPTLKQLDTIDTQTKALAPRVNGTDPALALPADVAALQTTVTDDYQQYQTFRDKADCERDGFSTTPGVDCSKLPGKGPIWREDQNRANDWFKKYTADNARLQPLLAAHQTTVDQASADAKKQVADLEARKVTLQAQRDAMIATQRASLDEDNGLLARLEALHRLTAKDSTLGTAYFVLFLFITMIEILPVMVKFLQSIGKRSLYDDVLDTMDASTKEVARLSAAHERIRAEQEFAERERQEREATRVHIAKIVAAESAVLDAQIEQWRTKELGLPPSPPEPGQTVEVSMTNR